VNINSYHTISMAKKSNFINYARGDWWAMGLCSFVHFMVLPKLYRWANRSRHLHSKICDIRGYHGKVLLWTQLWKRGLAVSLLKAQSCGNHYTWKGEAMYCALTVLYGTGQKVFLVIFQPLPSHNLETQYVKKIHSSTRDSRISCRK